VSSLICTYRKPGNLCVYVATGGRRECRYAGECRYQAVLQQTVVATPKTEGELHCYPQPLDVLVSRLPAKSLEDGK
jgi:hypothetical protein